MLQWNLSETPGKVPTEGELLALVVGLLMHEDIAYDALTHRELVLDDENLGRMAEIFEYRLPELAREFGNSECLRPRLTELSGIRVTCSPDRITP